MSEKQMQSRYEGMCRICGRSFPAGESIYWSKELGARHSGCEDVPLPENAVTIDNYEYGYTQGDVVRNLQRNIANGQPVYLYVLKASQQYYPEDGMSFGLPDDEGYIYTAQCRTATDEESLPLRQEEDRKAAVRQAKQELSQIAQQIQSQSTLPKLAPDGEWWHSTDEIHWGDRNSGYGTGSWFAVLPEWLLFVRNNGRDGDLWDPNNYHTGGAGAIAWGIPYDTALRQRLQALCAIVDQPLQGKRDYQQILAWATDPPVDY